MTITVEEIRQVFPNPVRSGGESGYCVGGAFIRYLTNRRHIAPVNRSFPCSSDLADALRLANPALSLEQAKTLAGNIILVNDDGDFEGAWGFLRLALSAGPAIDVEPEPEEEAVYV